VFCVRDTFKISTQTKHRDTQHTQFGRAMKRKISNKVNEIMEDEKQSDVPDISLQLIFCFLSLKDLPIIAQCSKRWYKIVTQNFFFKMYQHDNVSSSFNESNFPSFCSSPFRQAVCCLSFEINSDLEQIRFIPKLANLASLELEIDLYGDIDPSFIDYQQAFNLFPQSLRIFKVKIIDFDYSLIDMFLLSVSSITQINELSITSDYDTSNFLFIAALVNLTKLNISLDYSIEGRNSLFIALQSLSRLEELTTLDYHFDNIEIISSLRYLCNDPCVLSSLRRIPAFTNIAIHDQLEFVRLLKKLPALEYIHYIITNNVDISAQLASIIECLEISDHIFTDNDVKTIISISNLFDLSLTNCSITSTQFQCLFNAVGKQLKHLFICKLPLTPCSLLFECITNCPKLEKLFLVFNIIHQIEFAVHLYQLQKCTRLETLDITITDDDDQECCEKFKSILTLPSSIIPSLKNIVIQASEND
jgi:hypothetical protein